MKENNNTDNKLRQLENQSLPDLSKQDSHWQEMRKMLQPDLVQAKPSASGKIWKWFIAACAVTAIILFTEKKLRKETTDKKEITTIQPTLQKEVLVDTLKKTITVDTTTKPVSLQKNETRLAIQKTSDNKKQTYASLVSEKCNKCGTDWLNDTAVSTNDAPLPSKDDEPKATLASFFAQLEKPSQEFGIDNSKDTVITGKDGTALLIPANTFNTNGKVTLILKEYYSYEDIITNKLTTTSDGKQLVSGGMIHLTAMADGKEVDIFPGESIRWFIPDTNSVNSEMQLFSGQMYQKKITKNVNTSSLTADTMLSSSESNFHQINWRPQYQAFGNSALITEVKTLDLRDFPFRINTGKKVKAFFYMYKKSKLSKEDLIKLLKSRNKWYDRIIIHKDEHKEDWCSYKLFTNEVIDCYTSLGDTMTISPRLAKIYKLPIFDTITYLNRNSIRRQVSGSFQASLVRLNEKYSVELKNLGWINCDRFYDNPSPKIKYFVDLKDTASNYYTLLVFDKLKSMMTGIVLGNKIVFENIPEGETAKIISVGIRNGKPVAAMELVKISRNTFSGLKFEETTPAAFKEQAATMDK